MGSGKKKKDSLIEDFNFRLQRINFESKNMQSSYAINNPHMAPMASPVQQKAAKFNELISQVLDYSLTSNDDSTLDYGKQSSKLLPEFIEQAFMLD